MVEAALAPIHSQTPAWMRALLEVKGGADATRLYRSEDGRRMVLPLVRHGRGRLSGYRSLPHGWGSPGVLALQPITADDARVVFEDLAQLRGAHVGIRTDPDQQEAWREGKRPGFRSVEHATYTVEISNGFDHYWNATLSSATRTKIRKAEKLGVDVRAGTAQSDLPSFYQVYEAWALERSERRRIPRSLALVAAHRRDPFRKFEAAAEVLGRRIIVWVASLDGHTIAASVQIIHGQHSTYWRGYGLRGAHGRARATYLLQAKMIQEACARGCRWHHMGESGGLASLEHFKMTFGGQRRISAEYYDERLPVMESGRAIGAVQSWAERALAKSQDRK